MADELNKSPYNKGLKFPHFKDVEGNETNNGEFCDWKTLSGKRGAEDEIQFLATHFKDDYRIQKPTIIYVLDPLCGCIRILHLR